jgi:orotidine-5'-phosphate decarboxylase
MTELVVALDLRTPFEAQVMVHRLGSHVEWYKLGKRLVLQRGFRSLLYGLKDAGKRVMVDEKAWDIPSQLFEYAQSAFEAGVDALTIRCEREFLQAARAASFDGKRRMHVLGVGRLTSQGYSGAIGDAALCRELDCGLVIHPGALLPELREGLTMAATGVRPAGDPTDDHASAVTPYVAARLGARWAIVGRPIIRAASPERAARMIQDDLEAGSGR